MFKFLYSLCQGRLRDVALLGGAREIERLREHIENNVLDEVPRHPPPSFVEAAECVSSMFAQASAHQSERETPSHAMPGRNQDLGRQKLFSG